MRRRGSAVDHLPRWVRQPLMNDWLDETELADFLAGNQLLRYTAWCRWTAAMEIAWTPKGLDWRDLSDVRFPQDPARCPGIDPAKGRPPRTLLAKVLKAEVRQVVRVTERYV